MLSKLFDNVVDTVLSPIKDGAEIIDGLTEGELRTRAIARLGADVVATMTVEELVSWFLEN